MLHVSIVHQSVLAVTSTSPIESFNRINIRQVYAIFAFLIGLVIIFILHALIVVFLSIATIIVFIILVANAVFIVKVAIVKQVLLVKNAAARLLIKVARQARSWHHSMRAHLRRGVELVIRLCLLHKTGRWR